MSNDKEYLLMHTSSWEEDNASLPIQLLGNYFASHNSTIIPRKTNVSAIPLSTATSASGAISTSTTMIGGKENDTNKNNF